MQPLDLDAQSIDLVGGDLKQLAYVITPYGLAA
jgi:hypothetical protein